MLARIISFVKQYGFDLFVVACVVLIAITSYNLGQLHALKKTPLKIGEGANFYGSGGGETMQAGSGQSVQTPRDQRVVASKASDTKKYHHTWCSGAKRIKPENQIWFASALEAEKAGYTLAGNCQAY